MPIKDSGPLRLRADIGAEYGYSSTYAQLNKKFGGKIGKAAGETTRMSEFYGASGELTLKASASFNDIGYMSNNNTVDLIGMGVSPGDLVVIAQNAYNNYTPGGWSGMDLTAMNWNWHGYPSDWDKYNQQPGRHVAYGFWKAGDSNPTHSYEGAAPSSCRVVAIFSGHSGGVVNKEAGRTSSSIKACAMGLEAVSSPCTGIIATYHKGYDAPYTTPPPGWTDVGSAKSSQQYYTNSLGVAFIKDTSGMEIVWGDHSWSGGSNGSFLSCSLRI